MGRVGRRMPNFNKKNIVVGGLGMIAGAGAMIAVNGMKKNSESATETTPVSMIVPWSTVESKYIYKAPPGYMPGSPPIYYDIRTAETEPPPLPPLIKVTHYTPNPAPEPLITATSIPPQASAPPMQPSTQHRSDASVPPPPRAIPQQSARNDWSAPIPPPKYTPRKPMPTPPPPACDPYRCAPPPPYPPPRSSPSRSSSSNNNRIGNSNRNRRSLDVLFANLAGWYLKSEENVVLDNDIAYLESSLRINDSDHGRI